jgi:hypothetical protein
MQTEATFLVHVLEAGLALATAIAVYLAGVMLAARRRTRRDVERPLRTARASGAP